MDPGWNGSKSEEEKKKEKKKKKTFGKDEIVQKSRNKNQPRV